MKIHFYFVIFFHCLLLKAYSQIAMKKKTYHDVEYLEVSSKERKEILKKNLPIKTNGADIDEYYYLLKSGQVLYEIADFKTYLFSSKSDYDKFMSYSTGRLPPNGLMTSYSHPITDVNFINERNSFIRIFKVRYPVDLHFSDVETVRNVDAIINALDMETIKQYRASITAIIGEYLINNISESKWKWVNVPSQGRFPLIMTSNRIIDPTDILYTEFNKKVKKADYNISLYRQIKKHI